MCDIHFLVVLHHVLFINNNVIILKKIFGFQIFITLDDKTIKIKF